MNLLKKLKLIRYVGELDSIVFPYVRVIERREFDGHMGTISAFIGFHFLLHLWYVQVMKFHGSKATLAYIEGWNDCYDMYKNKIERRPFLAGKTATVTYKVPKKV